MSTDDLRIRQRLLPSRYGWAVFAVSFLVMFLAAGIIMQIMSGLIHDARARILTVSVLQGALVFVAPAFITWWLTSARPAAAMGIDRCVTPRWALWAIALYLLAYPAIDQTTFWNEHLHLPASMSQIEQTFRNWEDSGAVATQAILDTSSIGGLIVNILIIGVFTGFAEEAFFRGCLQKLFIRSGMGAAGAIIVSALIFSAVHMQFFGFIPRTLLGALFGYVYYRTGSLWAGAGLHALNNSIVVVSAWLTGRGLLDADIDSLFVTTGGFPWLFAASSAASILLIWITERSSHKH